MTESKYGDFNKFPVGTRIRINVKCEDFHFFNTEETGIVIRNDHRYLGIIVAFDEPRHFTDGSIQNKFNFNPNSLVIIEECNEALKNQANILRKKIEPNGCEHASDKIYCDKVCPRPLSKDEKYNKLLSVMKRISKTGCCSECITCNSCRAQDILREIGEEK